MKEKLQLTEVSAEDWLNQLRLGCIGMQSGTPRITYRMLANKSIEIMEGYIVIEADRVSSWVARLNDGYRTFYIVKPKHINCN